MVMPLLRHIMIDKCRGFLRAPEAFWCWAPLRTSSWIGARTIQTGWLLLASSLAGALAKRMLFQELNDRAREDQRHVKSGVRCWRPPRRFVFDRGHSDAGTGRCRSLTSTPWPPAAPAPRDQTRSTKKIGRHTRQGQFRKSKSG
jgi:hypothetical protein